MIFIIGLKFMGEFWKKQTNFFLDKALHHPCFTNRLNANQPTNQANQKMLVVPKSTRRLPTTIHTSEMVFWDGWPALVSLRDDVSILLKCPSTARLSDRIIMRVRRNNAYPVMDGKYPSFRPIFIVQPGIGAFSFLLPSFLSKTILGYNKTHQSPLWTSFNLSILSLMRTT